MDFFSVQIMIKLCRYRTIYLTAARRTLREDREGQDRLLVLCAGSALVERVPGRCAQLAPPT